jgi:hypothetical protein
MMDRRTALESILGTVMLHEPPHILSQLMEIVTGDWQPPPTEQEQLLEHIIECEYCQISLSWLVDSVLTEENTNDSSDNLVRGLLARQRESMRKQHVHYEQIAAYIETLEAQGEEGASKNYPMLVEHLQHCTDCRHLIESTRALFDEMEKDESDQVNKANTKRL